MTRTTEPPTTDDPVLGLIAKRKAEALARAEREHNQLASAARTYAQGTKIVTDAEEQLRKGRDKQDTAISAMVDAGLDAALVAETLGITTKAVSEATRRHRSQSAGDAAPAAPKPARAAAKRATRAKAAGAGDEATAAPAPEAPAGADGEPDDTGSAAAAAAAERADPEAAA